MGGLIDTIQLMAVLILAIPAMLAGLEFLLVRGEPVIGGALIGLAIGLVALKRFLSVPSGLSSMVASRLGSKFGREPEPAPDPTEEE